MLKQKAVQKSAPLLIAVGAVAIGAIVASGQIGKKPVVTSSIQVNKDRVIAPAVAVSQPESGRKPLAYYTGNVRSDLFSAPEPPKPKETPKPTAPPPPPPAPPVVVNPFADYIYAGTVTVGGRTLALVENTKTKEGQYLAEGDSFMGGKIGPISDRMLTVDVAGTPQMIAKRDDFKLTPLDKSAPYLQGAPAAGVPGGPGGPPPGAPGAAQAGGPGGPGGMPGMQGMPQRFQDRMRERMQNLSPEQRAKAEERMNQWRDNQFEGRGRERGRGDGEGRRERRRDDKKD